MITALMTALMLTVRPMVATVNAVDSSTVAVEVREDDGNIEIYEFYGDDFNVGDKIVLIMVSDAIVGVAER